MFYSWLSAINRLDQDKISLILQTLANQKISTDKKHPDFTDQELMLLAADNQLSSYDTAYLNLAKREQLPLETLDKKMKQLAQSMGLYLE